ncbi:MAG: hypothetical protein H6Q74_2736 [Firmicutes bacterium]|nr:hypothetical protein [Bacillota bacterium]
MDSHGNWRWKRQASASQAVAYSTSFENRTDCINNARSCGYIVSEAETPLSRDPFSEVRLPDPE